MNADHSAQLRLLDLQAADTALAQLAHRRKTLPELAAIAERDARLQSLHDELVDAETRLSDVVAEQRRLESDVDAVRSRASRDEQRLQSGGLPAKELESLQHELTTLARRQATLEDELLEVMERHEDADGAVSLLTKQREALESERADFLVSRDLIFGEIDAATRERTAQRALTEAQIPADLLNVYERAREHSGGVGAAVLRQRRCEGCHIELSGSELASVRSAAPDEVVRCDNCRRILVRTDESGL
ncbi:MAG: C4-type zinc ribbon domain-containing protein [Actinomycetota bacterium]|nr:C4-type zinc ribbon domain-containing protein [Actinomycetota bacterium]